MQNFQKAQLLSHNVCPQVLGIIKMYFWQMQDKLLHIFWLAHVVTLPLMTFLTSLMFMTFYVHHCCALILVGRLHLVKDHDSLIFCPSVDKKYFFTAL